MDGIAAPWGRFWGPAGTGGTAPKKLGSQLQAQLSLGLVLSCAWDPEGSRPQDEGPQTTTHIPVGRTHSSHSQALGLPHGPQLQQLSPSPLSALYRLQLLPPACTVPVLGHPMLGALGTGSEGRKELLGSQR